MFDTAPYYLILMLAIFPAMRRPELKIGMDWYVYLLLLVVFVGLRHEVGSDWGAYLIIADTMEKTEFIDLYQSKEFFYFYSVWLSVKTGLGIYGANIFTSWIMIYGLSKFCEKQKNRWLAMVTALPFLVIVIAMSANRQAAAIGVTLCLLALWPKIGISRKILLISVAASFHSSAIFILCANNGIPLYNLIFLLIIPLDPLRAGINATILIFLFIIK